MNKILLGKRILVTRPKHQAENLSRLIEQQGGIAVRFPTLEIVAIDDIEPLKFTLANLDNYHWVIFISANAVNFAVKANSGKIADKIPPGPPFSKWGAPHSLLNVGGESFLRPPLKKGGRGGFVAVGKATAEAMEMAGLIVDLVPENNYNSEALLALTSLQQIDGQRFLIVRGVGGREQLATTLRSRGAQVSYLEVYKRIIPRIDNSQVVNLLAQHRLDAITITSAEALQNLKLMLGEQNNKLLSLIPLVVVSDRIKCIAAEMGFNRIAVTDSPTDSAILEKVITCLTGE